MITDTIRLLHTGNFYGVSEVVEIAKGKYELNETLTIGKRKIVRKWHEQRKSR